MPQPPRSRAPPAMHLHLAHGARPDRIAGREFDHHQIVLVLRDILIGSSPRLNRQRSAGPRRQCAAARSALRSPATPSPSPARCGRPTPGRGRSPLVPEPLPGLPVTTDSRRAKPAPARTNDGGRRFRTRGWPRSSPDRLPTLLRCGACKTMPDRVARTVRCRRVSSCTATCWA